MSDGRAARQDGVVRMTSEWPTLDEVYRGSHAPFHTIVKRGAGWRLLRSFTTRVTPPFHRQTSGRMWRGSAWLLPHVLTRGGRRTRGDVFVRRGDAARRGPRARGASLAAARGALGRPHRRRGHTASPRLPVSPSPRTARARAAAPPERGRSARAEGGRAAGERAVGARRWRSRGSSPGSRLSGLSVQSLCSLLSGLSLLRYSRGEGGGARHVCARVPRHSAVRAWSVTWSVSGHMCEV